MKMWQQSDSAKGNYGCACARVCANVRACARAWVWARVYVCASECKHACACVWMSVSNECGRVQNAEITRSRLYQQHVSARNASPLPIAYRRIVPKKFEIETDHSMHAARANPLVVSVVVSLRCEWLARMILRNNSNINNKQRLWEKKAAYNKTFTRTRTHIHTRARTHTTHAHTHTYNHNIQKNDK